MASFGENLRREREMRGVTLQEIAAATKISVRILESIENEDFGKVPGGIFTRSFIRTYARYLGLDEEHVLAEYELLPHPRSEVNLARLAMARPEAGREKARGPLLTVLVALLMLAGGYALYRYTRQPPLGEPAADAAQPAPPPIPPAQQTALTTGTPETSSPVPGAAALPVDTAGAPGATSGVAAPPASAPVPATGVPEIPGGLVLQVAAKERAWVAIDVDGKTVLQRVLNPSEIETLNAKDSFDVTTGNAQGIILTLNGETLRPMGRRGEVKSVHLTHDDLKQISP